MNEDQPPTKEGQVPEDLGASPDDEPTSDVSPEPDWLRDMSGDQEAPDWLRRLFDEQAEDGQADINLLGDAGLFAQKKPDEAPPADETEGPEDADAGRSGTDELRQWFRSTEGEPGPPEDKEALPEWLQALDATDPSTEDPGLPDEMLAVSPESEDVPDWLRDLDERAEEHAPEKPVLEEPDEDALPDWLRDLEDRPSEAEETVEPDDVAPAPVPQDTGDLPEWLIEMTEEVSGEPGEAAIAAPRAPGAPEEPVEPEEPAALKEPIVPAELPVMDALSVAEEPSEELPAELPASEAPPEEPPEEPLAVEERPMVPSPEEELPATKELSAIEELPATKAPPEEPPAPVEPLLTKELPAIEEPPEADEPAEAEGVAPEPLAEDAEQEAEVPLWLTDVDQESPDETLSPAEVPSATKEPSPTGALSGAEDEDEAIVPDWLAEVDEAPEEQVEAPEWMQDLRGEEKVEGEPEPELEVETSGPLAGLAGLLSPQPLAGLSSKATFKPAPAVPEEHHVLAARVREMLGEPPARPELSVTAPGRTVMRALGHWLIYLALIAVIVAAMFVPALQDLVLAPESAASQDAYVTLLALPPGSEVLLVVDYDAAHDGELTPLTRVLLWHLITSGQRVVVISHTPQGTAMAEDLLASRALWAYTPAPVSGEQVLNLGYLPPHPASMQAFMADPLGGAVLWGKGAGADMERAQDTPLGQEIAGFGDLDAIVLVSASQEHTRWWIEQTRQAAPMLAAVSASVAPTLLPYYGTTEGAQLGGMLVGLAGAAEYERLCKAGFVPSARQNMILQGSAQILLAAIVLVSGISLVARRALGRKG